MPARLAQYLVAHGLIDAKQADESVRALKSERGSLDTLLLERGLISEERLLEALSKLSGQRPVNLSEFEINHSVESLVPLRVADRLGIVPLSLENDVLHIACTYPIPTGELTEMGFLLGKRLELWVALEVRIREWLNGLYGQPLAPRYSKLIAALKPEPTGSASTVVHELSLEEALAREMVERLATSVIAEPIPLQLKKAEARSSIEGARGKAAVRARAAKDSNQISDWSLQRAREALRKVHREPEAALQVALDFAEETFEFVAAFSVHHGMAWGREARGPGRLPEKIQRIAIPLDVFSVFRTVTLSRGSYIGPTPADAFSGLFLQRLGRSPRVIFLFPVESKGNVVLILYADRGGNSVSQRKLSELLLFCQALPAALSQLAPPAPESPARSPAMRPTAKAEEFPALFAQLTGPDASERAIALEVLATAPALFAPKLAAQFPGPSAWSRRLVSSLPDARELGPVPAALVHLGAAGAHAWAPLLDSSQLDTRYWAVLTAGSLPAPEFVDGIRRALFDPDPDVASAARVAATAFTHLPQLEPVVGELRRTLTNRDGKRRAKAAQALGALHDRGVIDGLIGMLGSDDAQCAQAASQALAEITKLSFGTDARQWMLWWAQNRRSQAP